MEHKLRTSAANIKTNRQCAPCRSRCQSAPGSTGWSGQAAGHLLVAITPRRNHIGRTS